jgi:hypothetical protein
MFITTGSFTKSAIEEANRDGAAPIDLVDGDQLADKLKELSGALQCSTLRRKVNRQAHSEVPTQLVRWVWAGGRKLNGLIRRRAVEAKLYQLQT